MALQTRLRHPCKQRTGRQWKCSAEEAMEEFRESSNNDDTCSLSYFRSSSILLFSLFAKTSFDLSEADWFNVI